MSVGRGEVFVVETMIVEKKPQRAQRARREEVKEEWSFSAGRE